MKIIVVGATGTIGSAVTKELGARHEIVKVGGTSGDVQVDMTSSDSIRRMYQTIG
jgi:nucleoside-diphosphate-sugar epimerase